MGTSGKVGEKDKTGGHETERPGHWKDQIH